MSKLVIELPEDSEVVVSTKKRKGCKHTFIGLRTEMINGTDLVHIAKIMRELSLSANWLIWGLILVRDYNTNLAKLEMKNESSALKQKAVRGYSELRNMGLVLKKGKSVFMINPEFLMPSNAGYEECVKEWNALRNKVNKK